MYSLPLAEAELLFRITWPLLRPISAKLNGICSDIGEDTERRSFKRELVFDREFGNTRELQSIAIRDAFTSSNDTTRSVKIDRSSNEYVSADTARPVVVQVEPI